jgi:hypothetical protein
VQHHRRKCSADAELRAKIEAQIVELQRDVEALRRQAGLYCTSYVRSIFPPPTSRLWDSLGQALERQAARPSDQNLWTDLQDALEARQRER